MKDTTPTMSTNMNTRKNKKKNKIKAAQTQHPTTISKLAQNNNLNQR